MGNMMNQGMLGEMSKQEAVIPTQLEETSALKDLLTAINLEVAHTEEMRQELSRWAGRLMGEDRPTTQPCGGENTKAATGIWGGMVGDLQVAVKCLNNVNHDLEMEIRRLVLSGVV